MNAFVVMPNHENAIISFVNTAQSINMIVGNRERFMAYDIIKMLNENHKTVIRKKLIKQRE